MHASGDRVQALHTPVNAASGEYPCSDDMVVDGGDSDSGDIYSVGSSSSSSSSSGGSGGSGSGGGRAKDLRKKEDKGKGKTLVRMCTDMERLSR